MASMTSVASSSMRLARAEAHWLAGDDDSHVKILYANPVDQSVFDGIKSATDVMVAGKMVLVAGYEVVTREGTRAYLTNLTNKGHNVKIGRQVEGTCAKL